MACVRPFQSPQKASARYKSAPSSRGLRIGWRTVRCYACPLFGRCDRRANVIMLIAARSTSLSPTFTTDAVHLTAQRTPQFPGEPTQPPDLDVPARRIDQQFPGERRTECACQPVTSPSWAIVTPFADRSIFNTISLLALPAAAALRPAISPSSTIVVDRSMLGFSDAGCAGWRCLPLPCPVGLVAVLLRVRLSMTDNCLE